MSSAYRGKYRGGWTANINNQSRLRAQCHAKGACCQCMLQCAIQAKLQSTLHQRPRQSAFFDEINQIPLTYPFLCRSWRQLKLLRAAQAALLNEYLIMFQNKVIQQNRKRLPSRKRPDTGQEWGGPAVGGNPNRGDKRRRGGSGHWGQGRQRLTGGQGRTWMVHQQVVVWLLSRCDNAGNGCGKAVAQKVQLGEALCPMPAMNSGPGDDVRCGAGGVVRCKLTEASAEA